MPVTDHFQRIPLSDIWVDRASRQRREIETKDLLESIRRQGVLFPIIVQRNGGLDGKHLLIAGERRYATSVELGLEDIPVRFSEELSSIELQIIELEENIKRKDLKWQEIVGSVAKIHQLYQSMEEGWTQEETTQNLGLTRGTVSLYLRVYSEITDPKIAEAGTVREAYNILARRDQRAAGDALEEIMNAPPVRGPVGAALEPLPPAPAPAGGEAPGPRAPVLRLIDPAKSILQESFLQWAPRYTGKKFNLIHCDFPYGIGVFDGPQGGASRHTGYDDSKDIYFRLLECLCANLDRVMSVSGHLLFWYSEKHGDATRSAFRSLAPSLVFQPYPLIWLKSDNVGIASDVRQGPRHIYETCMMATRQNRQIVKVVADAYSAPTDKRFHVSAKPEPMLKHFLTMFVDDNTRLLDPTCGGGSALRAAEALGASEVLGMDIDETTVGIARAALRQSRMLRAASAA